MGYYWVTYWGTSVVLLGYYWDTNEILLGYYWVTTGVLQ